MPVLFRILGRTSSTLNRFRGFLTNLSALDKPYCGQAGENDGIHGGRILRYEVYMQ